jgi:hypothetical protein
MAGGDREGAPAVAHAEVDVLAQGAVEQQDDAGEPATDPAAGRVADDVDPGGVSPRHEEV